MFSGIVQEIGAVQHLDLSDGILNVTVSASVLVSDLKIGDSISINGCCQTVIDKQDSPSKSYFVVQAVEETLKKTNLKKLKTGDKVNLETSLRIGDKISGHFVSGHVDCTGEVRSITSDGGNTLIKIKFPMEFVKFIAPKGSIAVNGVSLTVINVQNNVCEFDFALIPFTMTNTNLGLVKKGDLVNLEVDLIGRYLINYFENLNQGEKNTLSGEKTKQYA